GSTTPTPQLLDRKQFAKTSVLATAKPVVNRIGWRAEEEQVRQEHACITGHDHRVSARPLELLHKRVIAHAQPAGRRPPKVACCALGRRPSPRPLRCLRGTREGQ